MGRFPMRLFRIRLSGRMCAAESLMLTRELLDTENARIGIQRHRKSTGRVKLRQEMDVGHGRFRTETEAFTDASVDRRKPAS